MALFSRTPAGIPLTTPDAWVLPQPDYRILKRHGDEISELEAEAVQLGAGLAGTLAGLHVVRDDQDRVRELEASDPLGPVLQMMAEFRFAELVDALIAHWWRGEASESDREEIAGSVGIGIAFSVIERQRGQVREKQVHPWIYSAIASVPFHLDFAGWRHSYAIRAGYYLARVGPASISELVANAGSDDDGLSPSPESSADRSIQGGARAMVGYRPGLLNPFRCSICGEAIGGREDERCASCGRELDWDSSSEARAAFDRRRPDGVV